MKQLIFVLMFLSGLLQISGCASLNPNEKEINAMALKAYNEVKQQAKPSNNAHWKAMLDRVAGRIAASSGEKFDWEWMLIENPEMNAWCMPGGKMAVYTGIMALMQNEAELAAVLGHEVAHATKRHGKERYARAIKGNVAGLVIGGITALGGQALCESKSCELLTGLAGAAAGFAITFFDRKFSREEESEADEVGQKFMANAGYDPSAAISFWTQMAKKGEGGPPEFLSTHPSSGTRQKNLQKWLTTAEKVYQQAPQKYGFGEQVN
jgi:predicted Zn-dependent protease